MNYPFGWYLKLPAITHTRLPHSYTQAGKPQGIYLIRRAVSIVGVKNNTGASGEDAVWVANSSGTLSTTSVIAFPATHGTGEIVQTVKITEEIGKCVIKATRRNELTKQEAFHVFQRKGAGLVPGGDPINVLDTFASNEGPGCDWGTITIEASAVFYEFGTLPPSFEPWNVQTGSGQLYSVVGNQYQNPEDFKVTRGNMSNRAARRIRIIWDCYPTSKDKKSKQIE